jgi:hypothetical protein
MPRSEVGTVTTESSIAPSCSPLPCASTSISFGEQCTSSSGRGTGQPKLGPGSMLHVSTSLMGPDDGTPVLRKREGETPFRYSLKVARPVADPTLASPRGRGGPIWPRSSTSRRVVGWALAWADHMSAELVEDALKMAFAHSAPHKGVIIHSDCGCQPNPQAGTLSNSLVTAAWCSWSGARANAATAMTESFFAVTPSEVRRYRDH